MNLFKFLFLILFFGFCGNAKPQQVEEKIEWKEGVSLNWKDFKAKPPQNSRFKANTNAGITYSYGLKNENGIESLNYEVTAISIRIYPGLYRNQKMIIY